jgi:uncharacterized integral membrane protein
VPRRRVDTEQWQPRLWSVLIGLLLLALYLIAFVVRNDEQITIHFILFSASISLIWEIVFVFALGLLGGVLLSQLARRRRAQRGGQPADRGGDLSRGGKAEGETRG